jgi:hypothetical protein
MTTNISRRTSEPLPRNISVECGSNTITQTLGDAVAGLQRKENAPVYSAEKPRDPLLYAGVFVTLLLGLANLYFTLKAGKRSTFINTVTAERVKWLDKVRKNVSNLCALCDQWIFHRNTDSTPEIQRQIEQLKGEIRLQLNPDDLEDKEIACLLDRIPTWTQSITSEEYTKLQLNLVTATQAMLKREWDKVKDEAIHGDLRQKQHWWSLRREH